VLAYQRLQVVVARNMKVAKDMNVRTTKVAKMMINF
jgi:hypothetical protein